MSTEYGAVQKHCAGIKQILRNIASRGYAKPDMEMAGKLEAGFLDLAGKAINEDEEGKANRAAEKEAERKERAEKGKSVDEKKASDKKAQAEKDAKAAPAKK